MEEKKQIVISLKTLLLTLAIIIIILAFFTIKLSVNHKENTNEIANLQAELVKYEQLEKERQEKAEIYSHYVNINWLVKERLGNNNLDFEHIVYAHDLNEHYPYLDLKDGKLYHVQSEDPYLENSESYKSNDTILLDSITGNVEFIFLEYEKQITPYDGNFYAITDDGSLWLSDGISNGSFNNFKLVKKFDSAIIDIAFIENYDPILDISYETVYYLLSNGNLVDINGIPYNN